MNKNPKNPPTAIHVNTWRPAFLKDLAKARASGMNMRINRRIKSLAEAYALQRRLLKKAQRMQDAKRTFNVQEFHRALLAIEPGAWVCEYDRPSVETRTVSFKTKPGQKCEPRQPFPGIQYPVLQRQGICRYEVPLNQKVICIHPKEFCK
jgi:hypothetical protein